MPDTWKDRLKAAAKKAVELTDKLQDNINESARPVMRAADIASKVTTGKGLEWGAAKALEYQGKLSEEADKYSHYRASPDIQKAMDLPASSKYLKDLPVFKQAQEYLNKKSMEAAVQQAEASKPVDGGEIDNAYYSPDSTNPLGTWDPTDPDLPPDSAHQRGSRGAHSRDAIAAPAAQPPSRVAEYDPEAVKQAIEFLRKKASLTSGN